MRVRNISEKELASAYARLFQGETGRIVIGNMVSKYHKRSSFVRGDPHETAYREGARSVVLHIMAMIKKHGPSNEIEDIINE